MYCPPNQRRRHPRRNQRKGVASIVQEQYPHLSRDEAERIARRVHAESRRGS